MFKKPKHHEHTSSSSHKDRAVWFAERTAWPLRDSHPGALETHWKKHLDAPAAADLPKWQCAGPFNVAGRVTSLAVDPADHRLVYAGAAAGGVWRSRNGGGNWDTTWPRWANPHIGSLAIDPHNPQVLYCGTGEANLSADSYAGSGVYRSRDGGDTWLLLADAATAGIPRRIGTIGVHPYEGDGKILYLGGVTHDETMPSAIYASSDGGVTWGPEARFTSHNYWCHSIVFHPDGSKFAALQMNGAMNGIWRLDNEGWEQLEIGLPSPDRIGRVSLAISGLKPYPIYALVAEWRGKKMLGVYRSFNRGERWEQICPEGYSEERFMSYTNTIAVHPQDQDFVVWGGIDLHVTRDGGRKWQRATEWNAGAADPKFAHADHHALAMPGGELIYSGNDGGVAVSEDGGNQWSSLARGLVTTMFYSADVAPSNSGIFGGGAQDNGTLLTGIGEKDGDFERVLTGDGGWMVFDPADHLHVFGSAQNLNLYRHHPKPHWEPSSWEEVPLPAELLAPDEAKQTAIAVMAIDPTSSAKVKTIWAGSQRLWRTTNYGGTWHVGSEVFDGSVITAIEIATSNPEMLFVGTTRGGIFRSRDGGQTWSGNLAGPEVPMRLISQIRTHPRSAEKLVATVAGSGIFSRLIPHVHTSAGYSAGLAPDESIGSSHVFYSDDGGYSWRAIDSVDMPNVAYHAAVFESHAPYRLFVANDCGVWVTSDYRHWADLSPTLPNVMVTGLVYHHDDRILTACTYGRGIWRLALGTQFAQNKSM